jgi:hypothetical protein
MIWFILIFVVFHKVDPFKVEGKQVATLSLEVMQK